MAQPIDHSQPDNSPSSGPLSPVGGASRLRPCFSHPGKSVQWPLIQMPVPESTKEDTVSNLADKISEQ